MKFVSLAVAAATALALAGCAEAPRRDANECSFQENPSEKAPTWACAPHVVENVKDTGFGTHQKSGAGYQFSLDQASAKARVQLATQVKTRVNAMIRTYAATTGAGASETVDLAASSTTQQITAETLVGSKLMRSAVDSKGNVYVVVGMDLEASNRVASQALQSSMRNQPAIWQQLQANRSQAEMQAEIMKMGDRR